MLNIDRGRPNTMAVRIFINAQPHPHPHEKLSRVAYNNRARTKDRFAKSRGKWWKTGRGWKICPTRSFVPVAVPIFILFPFFSSYFNFSKYI